MIWFMIHKMPKNQLIHQQWWVSWLTMLFYNNRYKQSLQMVIKIFLFKLTSLVMVYSGVKPQTPLLIIFSKDIKETKLENHQCLMCCKL